MKSGLEGLKKLDENGNLVAITSTSRPKNDKQPRWNSNTRRVDHEKLDKKWRMSDQQTKEEAAKKKPTEKERWDERLEKWNKRNDDTFNHMANTVRESRMLHEKEGTTTKTMAEAELVADAMQNYANKIKEVDETNPREGTDFAAAFSKTHKYRELTSTQDEDSHGDNSAGGGGLSFEDMKRIKEESRARVTAASLRRFQAARTESSGYTPRSSSAIYDLNHQRPITSPTRGGNAAYSNRDDHDMDILTYEDHVAMRARRGSFATDEDIELAKLFKFPGDKDRNDNNNNTHSQQESGVSSRRPKSAGAVRRDMNLHSVKRHEAFVAKQRKQQEESAKQAKEQSLFKARPMPGSALFGPDANGKSTSKGLNKSDGTIARNNKAQSISSIIGGLEMRTQDTRPNLQDSLDLAAASTANNTVVPRTVPILESRMAGEGAEGGVDEHLYQKIDRMYERQISGKGDTLDDAIDNIERIAESLPQPAPTKQLNYSTRTPPVNKPSLPSSHSSSHPQTIGTPEKDVVDAEDSVFRELRQLNQEMDSFQSPPVAPMQPSHGQPPHVSMLNRQMEWQVKRELKQQKARMERENAKFETHTLAPDVKQAADSWQRAKKEHARQHAKQMKDEEVRLDKKSLKVASKIQDLEKKITTATKHGTSQNGPVKNVQKRPHTSPQGTSPEGFDPSLGVIDDFDQMIHGGSLDQDSVDDLLQKKDDGILERQRNNERLLAVERSHGYVLGNGYGGGIGPTPQAAKTNKTDTPPDLDMDALDLCGGSLVIEDGNKLLRGVTAPGVEKSENAKTKKGKKVKRKSRSGEASSATTTATVTRATTTEAKANVTVKRRGSGTGLSLAKSREHREAQVDDDVWVQRETRRRAIRAEVRASNTKNIGPSFDERGVSSNTATRIARPSTNKSSYTDSGGDSKRKSSATMDPDDLQILAMRKQNEELKAHLASIDAEIAANAKKAKQMVNDQVFLGDNNGILNADGSENQSNADADKERPHKDDTLLYVSDSDSDVDVDVDADADADADSDGGASSPSRIPAGNDENAVAERPEDAMQMPTGDDIPPLHSPKRGKYSAPSNIMTTPKFQSSPSRLSPKNELSRNTGGMIENAAGETMKSMDIDEMERILSKGRNAVKPFPAVVDKTSEWPDELYPPLNRATMTHTNAPNIEANIKGSVAHTYDSSSKHGVARVPLSKTVYQGSSSYRPTAELTANDPTGPFFDPSSTTDKGRHRLHDAREFETESLHRRSDVLNDAVSLLCGVRRDAWNAGRKHEEIITVMFDRSEFSERQAREWWFENKDRLL